MKNIFDTKPLSVCSLLEIFCSVEVRKTFLDCLNVEFDTEDEYGDIKTINILDL